MCMGLWGYEAWQLVDQRGHPILGVLELDCLRGSMTSELENCPSRSEWRSGGTPVSKPGSCAMAGSSSIGVSQFNINQVEDLLSTHHPCLASLFCTMRGRRTAGRGEVALSQKMIQGVG